LTPKYFIFLSIVVFFLGCRKKHDSGEKAIGKLIEGYSGIFVASEYSSSWSGIYGHGGWAILTSSPQPVEALRQFGENLGMITVNSDTLVYDTVHKVYHKTFITYKTSGRYVHNSSALGHIEFENTTPFSPDPITSSLDTIEKSNFRIQLNPSIKFDDITCAIGGYQQLGARATQTAASGATSINFSTQQTSKIYPGMNEIDILVGRNNDQIINGRLYRFRVESHFFYGAWVK
jgi:hypothetical protein